MSRPTATVVKRFVDLWRNNQDALVCVVDQGIISVAGFVTSVMVGRLGPEELGQYYIALSIILFFRGFQGQMVSVPYTIFHHRHLRSSLALYRGSCLAHQVLLIAVTLALLMTLIAAAMTGFVSPEMVSPLVSLLFFAPSLMMRECVRQFCFAHTENLSATVLDVSITVLQIGMLAVLMQTGYLSGTGAWYATGIACTAALGSWYWYRRPEIQFEISRVISDWHQNWSFGKWAVAGQLVGSLPTYLLPWILAAQVGTQGTGYFAAAVTLVGIANIFNMGMANYLTPKAARVYADKGAKGLRRVMLRLAMVFLVTIGAFAFALILWGGPVAAKLYGQQYDGLQTVMTLLALSKMFESFSILASSGLFVMERIQINFWIDVVLMLVTLTAAIFLTQQLGVLGAVWTTFVGSATSAILRCVALSVFLHPEHNVSPAIGSINGH